MWLPEGEESFRIRLAVSTEYRCEADEQTKTDINVWQWSCDKIVRAMHCIIIIIIIIIIIRSPQLSSIYAGLAHIAAWCIAVKTTTDKPVSSMKRNSSVGYRDDIVSSFILSSMSSMCSWWRAGAQMKVCLLKSSQYTSTCSHLTPV